MTMILSQLRSKSGQVTIMMVLMIGILLAGLVVFGWQRFNYLVEETQRTNDANVANLVFSGAAKKIQTIYFSEAGCDPDLFNLKVNTLPELPATQLYAGVPYSVAEPTQTNANLRANRCTGGTGCRQIGVEQGGRGYIVTIGQTTGIPDSDADTSTICPRDTTVKMKLTVRGNVYIRRATLINICSFDSCGGAGPNGETSPEYYDSDPTVTSANQPFVSTTAPTAQSTTTACGNFTAGAWGDIVGTDNRITVDDLRWLRRYVRTGAGDIGDTAWANFDTFDAGATTNGACPVTDARCARRPCVPRMDLNQDGTNNEVDIAILEYYLRGYHRELPAIGY